MRGVPEEAVRLWRARRLGLSRPVRDLDEALAAMVPPRCAPSTYLAMFARLDAFDPSALDARVFGDRSLRIFPLHHGLALVPFETLPALLALRRFAAGSRARRSSVERRIQAELGAAAADLLPGLSTRAETVTHLAGKRGEREVERALGWLAAKGDVVVGRSPENLFGEATFALPRADDRVTPAPPEGFGFLQEAALLYFRAAGPATRDDFLWWAGLSRSAARHTIEDLAGLLEEVDLEGERKAHFMLEEDAAELRDARAVRSARPAFITALDPAGLASKGGFARLCDPRLAASLAPSGRGGWRRLALIGGTAVGTWGGVGRGFGVEFTPAKALGADQEAALGAEAARLSEFVRTGLAPLPGAPPQGPTWARLL